MTIGTVAALALAPAATGAAAAPPPTLGPVTIITAGHRTPVDVAGNHLHQGATIREGTELRRWLVTMHGASNAAVTLSCGPRGTQIGLALPDPSKVGLALAHGTGYYHETIKVHFYTPPHVTADGARGHIYALCRIA
ncbi:MAG TPA: hypothetical protein VG165_04245 [Solirubrobacteraceae bacterium]|nr:hypothetical protein [Solirubrobacteraceae bacterium]